MSHLCRVLNFPDSNAILDVPAALRGLADAIDRGDYDDAYNLTWAMDCGDGRIEVGLLGKAPEPAITAYYLLGLAQRKLERI